MLVSCLAFNRVDLEVVLAAVLANDHAFVDRGVLTDEQRTAALRGRPGAYALDLPVALEISTPLRRPGTGPRMRRKAVEDRGLDTPVPRVSVINSPW